MPSVAGQAFQGLLYLEELEAWEMGPEAAGRRQCHRVKKRHGAGAGRFWHAKQEPAAAGQRMGQFCHGGRERQAGVGGKQQCELTNYCRYALC